MDACFSSAESESGHSRGAIRWAEGRNRASKKGSWSGVNDGSGWYDVGPFLLHLLCQHCTQVRGCAEERKGNRSYKR